MLNKNFYPTPSLLISKMVGKIQNKQVTAILEPSAGKGDIIEFIKNHHRFRYPRPEIKAIELDDDLFATLKGKDIEVIERDFLEYNGGDIFDLIIMNPPFDEGDKHLLKAIDILYSGEIICLLNAETIRNPYNFTRKELLNQLTELNAEIEFIKDAFIDAERKTNVEIALIYLKIQRDIETDLLGLAKDTIQDESVNYEEEENTQLTLNDSIGALEIQYYMRKQKAKDAIINFYKSGCSNIVELKVGDCSSIGSTPVIHRIQKQINKLNSDLRKIYWDKALNLPKLKEKMTTENRDKFYAELKSNSHLEFTANNVRAFAINLIGTYEQNLINACVKLFDDLTHKYSYWRECDKNTLHFSTWKTNTAFKLNRKVIKPCYPSYGGNDRAFRDYNSLWKLDYKLEAQIDDIDKIMNYFEGHENYLSISRAIKNQMRLLNEGHTDSTTTQSTFFSKITFYKKGTLHLTFRDENLLRKFNIIACKGKNWLPEDYGQKDYKANSARDKEVIDSFEGEKSYTEHLGELITFANPVKQLLLT